MVGIVASRLKDRFHRPAIVFARGGDGELKGSGRSIAGFHLRDALDLVSKRAPGVIARFGGHAFAAGLSIARDAAAATSPPRSRRSRARRCPTRNCSASTRATAHSMPRELTLELGTALGECVWGQGFPPPAFDDTFDVVEQRVVGDGHAKLTLARGGERFDAIAVPHPARRCRLRIHALFRPEVNDWNGLASLELVIEHWTAA